MRETRHGDASIVFSDDADIVLDDPFAEIEVTSVGFGIFGRGGVGENVGSAEMRAEFFGDDGPAHEFGDGEEFKELGFGGDEGVAGVGLDAVEEVGLFVVVGGEDDVVDYTLENLEKLVIRGVDWQGEKDQLTARKRSGSDSTNSVSRTWR